MGHTKLFFCKCENKGNMNKKPGILHVHTYTRARGRKQMLFFQVSKQRLKKKQIYYFTYLKECINKKIKSIFLVDRCIPSAPIEQKLNICSINYHLFMSIFQNKMCTLYWTNYFVQVKLLNSSHSEPEKNLDIIQYSISVYLQEMES